MFVTRANALPGKLSLVYLHIFCSLVDIRPQAIPEIRDVHDAGILLWPQGNNLFHEVRETQALRLRRVRLVLKEHRGNCAEICGLDLEFPQRVQDLLIFAHRFELIMTDSSGPVNVAQEEDISQPVLCVPNHGFFLFAYFHSRDDFTENADEHIQDRKARRQYEHEHGYKHPRVVFPELPDQRRHVVQ